MNYRHAYHAGNFADVFKHIILVALTKTFLRKDTAFCYLDTHAGIGTYDLRSPAAQKSQEFTTGISKILAAENPPPLIQEYLNCIATLNSANDLQFYPGSPYIVQQLLRAQDRSVLCELHPEDQETLKQFFYRDKRIAVHCLDAYLSLKAFLPPQEKRGFVLIDPPYEKPNEFELLLKTLPQTIQHWETGVYALWYPIKSKQAAQRFITSLKAKINKPMLSTDLSIYEENSALGLGGCGVVIINPPWQLDEELKTVLPWLWRALSVDKKGKYSIALL